MSVLIVSKIVHWLLVAFLTLYYGRMAARQLCWTPAILFYHCSLDLFSPPNLRGRLADRHQTLPHVLWWPRFIKFCEKFGWLHPLEIWRSKNVKILAWFRTTSQLDRKYRRNATRLCQSENGVASYGHSCTGKLNLVYFGTQMAKHRPGVLNPPDLWWQTFCSCPSRAMEQLTATSQRCWLIIQSVPAVTRDIFVWIVGPRRSVNYFNCAI